MHVSPINCIVIIENDLFLYIEVLMYVLNNFIIIINTTRLRLIGKITLDKRKYEKMIRYDNYDVYNK